MRWTVNFKTRYMIRNLTLSAFYWCFGVTSLLSAYTYIRWQKAVYYTDWAFKNVDLSDPKDVTWVIDNYLCVNGVSIYWCFVIAVGVDLVLKKLFIKRS